MFINRKIPKRQKVQRRKAERTFSKFIKGSQIYYRRATQSLAIGFELNKVFNAILDGRGSFVEYTDQQNLSPTLREPSIAVTQACFCNLIRTGDLSRWREIASGKRDRDWTASLNYYLLAEQAYVQDGTSRYKQSLISTQKGDTLDSVYHLYRSLTCTLPCADSWKAIEAQTRASFSQGDVIGLKKIEIVEHEISVRQNLLQAFLCTHFACFFHEVPLRKDIEAAFLNSIELCLHNSAFESDVSKILLANIAVEQVVQGTLQGK